MKAVYQLSSDDVNRILSDAIEKEKKGTVWNITFQLRTDKKASIRADLFGKGSNEEEFDISATVEMEEE